MADSGALAFVRRVGRALLAAPRALACIAPLAWAAGIAALSSRPLGAGLDLGPALAWLWNLGHAPLFGLLALWLLPLLPREGDWVRLDGAHITAVALVAIGYGALDEWHQSFVPGRGASLWDVLTDASGVAGVLWIAAYAGRERASEGGLWLRLAAAALVCIVAAGWSTFAGVERPASELQSRADERFRQLSEPPGHTLCDPRNARALLRSTQVHHLAASVAGPGRS